MNNFGSKKYTDFGFLRNAASACFYFSTALIIGSYFFPANIVAQENPQQLSVLQDSFAQRLELKLRFSHIHGNFLVFYDSNNIPVYLQYRHDAFDHESDHVKNRVQRGIAYRADLTLTDYRQQIPLSLSQVQNSKSLLQENMHPVAPATSAVQEEEQAAFNTTAQKISKKQKPNSFSVRSSQGVYIGILYELHYLSPSYTRF